MSDRTIEVISSGLLTTVQDLGRRGYQRYGIPVCGALDPVSLRIANILVGNSERRSWARSHGAGADHQVQLRQRVRRGRSRLQASTGRTAGTDRGSR